MDANNPFAPPVPSRAPLPAADAAPIAGAAAVPVLLSLVHGFAVPSLVGGFVAAGLFFAGALTVLRHGQRTVSTCLFGGAVVGAVTGVAWWALVDTTRSLEECAMLGSLGGAALLAIELYRATRRLSES